MILENFSIEQFLGLNFFLPIFIYLALVIFDGFGIFRDAFFLSGRRSRK